MVWLGLWIPLAAAFNLAVGLFQGEGGLAAPIPLGSAGTWWAVGVFWAVYLAAGVLGQIAMTKRKKKPAQTGKAVPRDGFFCCGLT